MKNSRIKKYGKIVLPHKSHDHTIWGKKKQQPKTTTTKPPKTQAKTISMEGIFCPKLSEF